MKVLTATELHEKLELGEVLLVDVREPEEHELESIAQAYLIPLSQLTEKTLPSTSLPVVFHCKSGKRSEEACRKILACRFDLELYSLEGGILAWKDAGFPVKKNKV